MGETNTQRISMRVQAMCLEAEGILSLALHPLNGGVLPAVEAGAHIDLHLSSGLIRSYSLITPRCTADCYVVAVLLEKNSRGGSRYIHKELRVAQIIEISGPRNHFRLNENAQQTVLIAGGIGITPIFSMYARLLALEQPVNLLYCGRSRQHMSLLDDVAALGKPIELHIDEEAGAAPDIKAFLCRFGAAADYYCCGPAPMLDRFEVFCEELAYPNVHVERFTASHVLTEKGAGRAYQVVLARSQRNLQVAAGQSLYEALLAAGVHIEFSCREGVCGTCEVKVLEGIPEHRDSVLSPSERAANKSMMVCTSGCKSDQLVLDL